MAHATETAALAALQEKFPGSPNAELLRFHRARPKSVKDAAKMYSAYQTWRAGPGVPENLTRCAGLVIPEWVRTCGTALDGTPLVYVQGARYDPEVGPDTHICACAHAIDQLVGPQDMTRITLLIDVRGGSGPGWINPPVQKLLPFFRMVSNLLSANYPERAHRLIVYPMPNIMKHIWMAVSAMLDSNTKKKIVLLTGSDRSEWLLEFNKYASRDQLPVDARPLHSLEPGSEQVHDTEASLSKEVLPGETLGSMQSV